MAITKLNASVDLLNDVDTTTAAPADKELLAWDSSTSQWVPSEGNFVEEAPTSGLVYGRANGTWVEVTGGGGGGTGGAGSVNLAYDKLTPDGTADTFDLTLGGDAREPLGATNLLVSVNGVIQEPGVAFTTAGSTITFAEVPQADDVIDFIVELTNGSHWVLNGVNLEYAGDGTKVIVDQFQANGDAVFNGNVGINANDPKALLDVRQDDDTAEIARLRIWGKTNNPMLIISGDEAGGAIDFKATGSTAGSSLTWSTSGKQRMVLDGQGNVGIGTNDPKRKLSVKSEVQQLVASFETLSDVKSVISFADANTSNDTAVMIGSIADSLNLYAGSNNNPAMTINDKGNVGIGIDPTTGTFDLTAKEQLAEWKTKAKKASWPIVTDGAFEQEPTEDLVAEWIETRAAGDKLQVAGNGSFTGVVSARGGVSVSSNEGAGQVHSAVTLESTDSYRGTGVFFRNTDSDQEYFAGCSYRSGMNFIIGKSTVSGGGSADRESAVLTITPDGNAKFSGGSFSPADAGQWTKGAITTTGSYGGGIAVVDGSAGFGIWAQEQGKQLVMGYGSTSGTLASDFILKSDASATFRGTVTAPILRTTSGNVYRPGQSGCHYSTNFWLPLNSTSELSNGAVDLGAGTYQFKDAYLSGSVKALRVIQDGAPVIDAKGLINTLSTLRKATMDETKDIRESLRSAIDELVAGFEQEIAAMPAPEPEASTMPAGDES